MGNFHSYFKNPYPQGLLLLLMKPTFKEETIHKH